jgi:lysophospholipase L1-like esterase
VALTVAFLAGLAWVGPGLGRDANPEREAAAARITTPERSITAEPATDDRADTAPSGRSFANRIDPGPDRSTPAILPPVARTGPGPGAERRPGAILDVEPTVVSSPGRGAKAVFLGDSYTSGWNGAGLDSRGWPAIVAAARGWKVVNLAVPGTGFMNPGWTNEPIGSRVDATIRQHPRIVFVAGGHNDSRWTAAATSQAAGRVIDRLHAALPGALIVVIGPIWQDGRPPLRCLLLRDALRRKASAVGALFIDPLAERWFTGTSHRFIAADGFHPTDAGHRYLANRVLADLTGI